MKMAKETKEKKPEMKREVALKNVALMEGLAFTIQVDKGNDYPSLRNNTDGLYAKYFGHLTKGKVDETTLGKAIADSVVAGLAEAESVNPTREKTAMLAYKIYMESIPFLTVKELGKILGLEGKLEEADTQLKDAKDGKKAIEAYISSRFALLAGKEYSNMSKGAGEAFKKLYTKEEKKTEPSKN